MQEILRIILWTITRRRSRVHNLWGVFEGKMNGNSVIHHFKSTTIHFSVAGRHVNPYRKILKI